VRGAVVVVVGGWVCKSVFSVCLVSWCLRAGRGLCGGIGWGGRSVKTIGLLVSAV